VHVPFEAQKKLGAQSTSETHGIAHVAFVPSQTYPVPQAGLPAEPWRRIVQVPSAVAPPTFVHASHAPAHAASQQTPSETKPLAQVAGFVEDCPFFNLQTPLALHVCVPVHVSGSSAFWTGTQEPVPLVQVWQTPLHAPEQQMPSSQTPEAHSPPKVQTAPFGTSAKTSALERAVTLESPPATSTLSEPRSAARWYPRAVVIEPVATKLDVPSKSSEPETKPPAM
jgi:hypothetical protein